MLNKIVAMVLLNRSLGDIAAYVSEQCPNMTSAQIAMLIGMAQEWATKV